MRSVAYTLAQRHDVQVLCQINSNESAGLYNSSFGTRNFPPYLDGAIPVRGFSLSVMDRVLLFPAVLQLIPRLRRYFLPELKLLAHPAYRVVFAPKLAKAFGEADVVHMFGGEHLGRAALHAAVLADKPFVVTPFAHPGWWGDDPLNLELYRRADALVALLETEKEFYVSHGVDADKVHVVGVSPDLVTPQDPDGFRMRWGLNGPVVLFVGVKRAYKGFRALLEAAPLVWQRFPETRFVFIGPDVDGSADLFRGADPRIINLGGVDPIEKATAIAACDLVCLPSTSEILPTVFLEAWTLGKPAVGADIPTVREMLVGGGGGLVAGPQPAQLAEELLRLLMNPELRRNMGQTGRNLVTERYSAPAVAASLEAIYHRVLSDRNGRRSEL